MTALSARSTIKDRSKNIIKMKKIFFGIYAAIMFTSLSYSQVNSLTNKGIVSINLKTKEVKEVIVKTENQDIVYSTISLIFKCDKQMQSFSSEKELKDYISKNPLRTSGTLELYVDNEITYSVQIIDGVKTNEHTFNSSTEKKYPCTYQGIRQCAIDGIHDQNWFQMTTCVIEGFDCVVQFYINCTIDNC